MLIVNVSLFGLRNWYNATFPSVKEKVAKRQPTYQYFVVDSCIVINGELVHLSWCDRLCRPRILLAVVLKPCLIDASNHLSGSDLSPGYSMYFQLPHYRQRALRVVVQMTRPGEGIISKRYLRNGQK